MIRRVFKYAIIVLAVGMVAIQFIPVVRTNPPVLSVVNAPEPVLQALRRSCFDCHSNETLWPWYSHVAPVSWLVARDVRKGREVMNFSDWYRYSPAEQSHLIHEAVEETAEGEMPLRIYEILHPKAKLSRADVDQLRAWAGSLASKRGAGHLRDDDDDDDD